MQFPTSITWWVFSSNITCALPTESIDLRGSICIVLTPGDSKVRPCLSTRAAGFIGERCFQSLIFLPLERRRCLLYVGLEGVGPCSPLSLCCSRVFGPLCEGRAHVGRKEKPHSLVSMQELIIPESLFFKRLAFQRFKVLLPVRVVGTGEGAVLTPQKVYSQDADVISQHNTDEKTTQSGRKKRRKWQLLR